VFGVRGGESEKKAVKKGALANNFRNDNSVVLVVATVFCGVLSALAAAAGLEHGLLLSTMPAVPALMGFGLGVLAAPIVALLLRHKRVVGAILVFALPTIAVSFAASNLTNMPIVTILAAFIVLGGSCVVGAVFLPESHVYDDAPMRLECERCRYDLTGNTTGRCPECGAGQFHGEVS